MHQRRIKIKDFPKDVETIIEYTRLKKKYPKFDMELRLNYRFDKDSITFCQMITLLASLRKKDEDEKNNKSKNRISNQ